MEKEKDLLKRLKDYENEIVNHIKDMTELGSRSKDINIERGHNDLKRGYTGALENLYIYFPELKK